MYEHFLKEIEKRFNITTDSSKNVQEFKIRIDSDYDCNNILEADKVIDNLGKYLLPIIRPEIPRSKLLLILNANKPFYKNFTIGFNEIMILKSSFNYNFYDKNVETISFNISLLNYYKLKIINTNTSIKVLVEHTLHNLSINAYSKTYSVKRETFENLIIYISKRKSYSEFFINLPKEENYIYLDCKSIQEKMDKAKFLLPFHLLYIKNSTVDNWIIRNKQNYQLSNHAFLPYNHFYNVMFKNNSFATNFILPYIYNFNKELKNIELYNNSRYDNLISLSFEFLCGLKISRALLNEYIKVGDYNYIIKDLYSNSLSEKIVNNLKNIGFNSTIDNINEIMKNLNFITFNSEKEICDFIIFIHRDGTIRYINNKSDQLQKSLIEFIRTSLINDLEFHDDGVYNYIRTTNIKYNNKWKHICEIISYIISLINNYDTLDMKSKSEILRTNSAIGNSTTTTNISIVPPPQVPPTAFNMNDL